MSRRKEKKNKIQENEKKEVKSIEYTIEELIELGEKKNNIELAPPLFEKKENK